MDAHSTIAAPERLLAESEWLVRLARSLVSSEDDAEDLAQDTIAAALAHPPDSNRPLRPWLWRIAKNLSIMQGVARAQRVARERKVARAEQLLAADEVVARVSMQRTVVEAVLGLAEPYRSTILLRFWDGLPPRKIAERLRVPVETVRTRLKRGLGLLRDRLDRRHGSRDAWIAVLVPISQTGVQPLVASGSSVAAYKAGIFAMSTQGKVIAAALVVLALTWISFRDRPLSITTEPRVAATPEVGAKASASEPGRDSAPLEITARTLVAVDAQQPSLREAKPDARTILGVVIDPSSTPLGGVEVEFTPSGHGAAGSPVRAMSDTNGRFELSIESPGGTIRPVGEAWVCVFEPHARVPDPVTGYVLVVSGRFPLVGRVQDELGSPIAGADVQIGMGRPGPHTTFAGSWPFFDGMRASITLPLDESVGRTWGTRSDDQGVFKIDDAPTLDAIPLDVSAPEYSSFHDDIRADRSPLVVVLKRPSSDKKLIEGRVTLPDGSSAVGATVLLGRDSTKTVEDGVFVLDLARTGDGRSLIAAHVGWAPVSQQCLTNSAASQGAWPDPLVLQLKERVNPILGRIVDELGNPVEKVEVTFLDAATPNEVVAFLYGQAAVVSGIHGGDRAMVSTLCLSDSRGEFELPVILDRLYRLRAIDPRSQVFSQTDAIAPGASVTITLAVNGPRIALGGRVVDPRGAPLAGATVSAMRRIPEPGSESLRPVVLVSGSTDSEGKFQLGGVALPIDCIAIQPERAGPGEVLSFPPGQDPGSLTLVAGRLGHVQIEIATQGMKASAVVMLDSQGNRLQISVRRGDGGSMGGETMPIMKNRSEQLVVSETARTAVLLRNNEEVARVPVRVNIGELITLRF